MEKEPLQVRIASLDKQIIELQSEKQRIETELKSLNSSNPTLVKPTNNFTPEEKIGIFRQFFRGRDDVYARFWTSSKTGRKGYSPACKNEWATKVCRKPALKCSECPNREYSPLDEQVIRRHLSGEMVAGTYPMLKNESCYFLAVDFDKEGWQEEVFAFAEICQGEGVPVAVERSRSGNGAHAWIFFAEEISAAIARQMGCFLITRTMPQKCRLDLKSYDRLFPNQDTLPKGGLGNLIALPLQKEAVRVGNSVFIDSMARPYPDQWFFLSSIKKLSKNIVSQIADQATRTNQVISARMVPTEENDVPWMQLPSGKKPYKPAIPDLPSQMQVVVADRIYIKMAGVPKVLLNQLQQLAAFQNPEFYKRQHLRLSTHITPRVICCAETSGEYLSRPRGCIHDLRALLDEYGITFNLEDKRFPGHRAAFKFYGGLTKEQKLAVKKILENDLGILVAPPGTGKTVLAIAAIEKRKTNTLILVHRKPLLDQWRTQVSAFLGIDIKKIGQIGSGKNKATGILDVAMLQSLERKGKVDDRIADYGFIIVDECHYIGAVSFEQVLTRVKAKYVLGLTATPYRRDGHQPIIHMQC